MSKNSEAMYFLTFWILNTVFFTRYVRNTHIATKYYAITLNAI